MATADTNPFRVSRLESLAFRAPAFRWDAFLETLDKNQYRGAIVGPHGSGKTTLLLEAQQRLEETGIPVRYGFLNAQSPRKRNAALDILRDTPRNAVLFLDGAEQLDALSWQWLRWQTRRLRGFIVTTHTPGRLPTLYETHSSEAMLRDLLEELIPDEADRQWAPSRDHFLRHDGNLRDTFFALYDDYARTPDGACPPTKRSRSCHLDRVTHVRVS